MVSTNMFMHVIKFHTHSHLMVTNKYGRNIMLKPPWVQDILLISDISGAAMLVYSGVDGYFHYYRYIL